MLSPTAVCFPYDGLAFRLNVGLPVFQLHLYTNDGNDTLACEVACSWLLTQARNIQVMPSP